MDQFYEDLEDVLEVTPKIDYLLIMSDWNVKIRSQDIPGVTGKFCLGKKKKMKQGKGYLNSAKRMH